MGEAELSPSVAVGSEWRSNLYHSAGAAYGEPTVSGADIQVRPGATLDLDGRDLVMRLSGSYLARFYLEEAHRNLDTWRDGSFSGELQLLPGSIVGLRLLDDLTSTTTATDAAYASDSVNSHFSNYAKGFLRVRPGGAMSLDLGGHLDFDDYDVPTEANAAYDPNLNQRWAYGPTASLKWTFFPKTALRLDYHQEWFKWRYNNLDATGDEGSPGDIGSVLPMPDGLDWRVTAGVMGRITDRLVLDVLGGYGQAVYDETSVDPSAGSDASYAADLKGFPGGLLATAELTWNPLHGHELSCGYSRDFKDSWFTNYLYYDYFYARYRLALSGSVGLLAEWGFRLERYGGVVARTDRVPRARAGLSYSPNDWFGIDLQAHWDERGSVDGNPLIEYDDFGISGFLTLSY